MPFKVTYIQWLSAIFLFLLIFASFRNSPKITQTQAILLAENFIRDQGYTYAPPDKSKFISELNDRYDTTIEQTLKKRHGCLHKDAYFITEYLNKDFFIGFLSSKINVENLDSTEWKTNLPGSAVIVKNDGSEVRMEHKAPMFSLWKRL